MITKINNLAFRPLWPDFKLDKSVDFCMSAHPCSHSSILNEASLKTILYLITNTGLYIC